MGTETETYGEKAWNHHAGAYPGRDNTGMVQSSAARDAMIMESGETADSEQITVPKPMQDAEIAYVLAAAAKRMTLDQLIASWRDWLHYGMQTPGGISLIDTIHAVM